MTGSRCKKMSLMRLFPLHLLDSSLLRFSRFPIQLSTTLQLWLLQQGNLKVLSCHSYETQHNNGRHGGNGINAARSVAFCQSPGKRREPKSMCGHVPRCWLFCFLFFQMPSFILVPLSCPIQWHHTWYRILPPNGKKILKINWNYIEPSRCQWKRALTATSVVSTPSYNVCH